MIKELESFFYSMKVGEKVTNSLLVEFLEMKGLKIENTIKTDVVLEIVKEINLSEYCITSHATAQPSDENKENLFQIENKPGIRVLVKKAQGKKCPRCWKITTKKCDKKTCAM